MYTKIKGLVDTLNKIDSVDITKPADNKDGRQYAEEMADDLIPEMRVCVDDSSGIFTAPWCSAAIDEFKVGLCHIMKIK